MAKWDLSKLPEGRKPLPDAWFAERAQMQDRIEELEAKLAKAADVIEWALICGDEHQVRDWVHDAINVLSELTGGKDE